MNGPGSARGRVAVVTGGSSGIGLAAARLFRQKGYTVFELSRRGEGEQGIFHIGADVGDEDSVKTAMKAVFDKAGRLDALILSAGFGISGPVEATPVRDAARLLDVNFFGAVRCINAAVPYMRESGGSIVCLSSVAAPMAIPFQAFYSCSKAAVNALVLALRLELRGFGIRVSGVMPGDTATGFTAAREKNTDSSGLYGGADERAVSAMERDETGGMTPESVAKYVYRAAAARRPRPFYVAGAKYRFFIFLSRLLPASFVNRAVGLIYGVR